jgi:hypothetical protein
LSFTAEFIDDEADGTRQEIAQLAEIVVFKVTIFELEIFFFALTPLFIVEVNVCALYTIQAFFIRHDDFISTAAQRLRNTAKNISKQT